MEEASQLSCLSHHLIGLSPTYWNYNPLHISTIQNNFLIVNGVDVLLIPTINSNAKENIKRTSVATRASENQYKCKGNKNGINVREKQMPILQTRHIIPMNRCELVGILQYVHYKANGSLAMVLDDGTGLMDCILWKDYDYDFILKIEENDDNNQYKQQIFNVGDLVRIRGQLQKLAINHDSQVFFKIQNNHGCDNENNQNEIIWEGKHCEREIKIHFIEKMNEFVKESLHWMRCLQFIKRIENTSHILTSTSSVNVQPQLEPQNLNQIEDHDINMDTSGSNECFVDRNDSSNILASHIPGVNNDQLMNEDYFSYNEGWEDQEEQRLTNTPIYNGLDIFNMGSKETKHEILPYKNTINSKPSDGQGQGQGLDGFDHNEIERKIMMEYFGRQCRCQADCVPYKEALLYCHCSATIENLDRAFIFRDAVLNKLLDIEAKFYNLQEQKHNEKRLIHNTKNIMSNDITTGRTTYFHSDSFYHRETDSYFFKFQYSTIAQDVSLLSIAKELVAKTSHPETNLHRLFTKTFQRLRNDGIVNLIDLNEDTYMLLSKDHVLIPVMNNIMMSEEQYKYSESIRLESLNRGRSSCTRTNVTSYHRPVTIPSFCSSIPFAKMNLLKRVVALKRRRRDYDIHKL